MSTELVLMEQNVSSETFVMLRGVMCELGAGVTLELVYWSPKFCD